MCYPLLFSSHLGVPAESPKFSLDILLKELSSPKYTLEKYINDRKET